MGWPAADANQLYVVFYPPATLVNLQGAISCHGFGGYHEEGNANQTNYPYAVIPRCAGLDQVTVAVSHEIIEAATDPDVETNPAYAAVDADHYTWSFFPGGEVGDMCNYEKQANQRLVGNFMVQRIWSNSSAQAGHDPCVPALMQPYFNSAPDFKDTIKLGFGPSTKGMKIPIGQMGTVDVDLFSDAPTQPWQVDAVDVSALQGQNPELQFSWDKNSGQTGDVLHLTVTAVKGSQYGISLFMIRSVQGFVEHYWYGAVANK
jgi:hypothetical protein